MKILALSNCLLDHASGSGRTRLAWAEGLRSLGHEVTTVESLELLGGSEGAPAGRRVRIAWGAWRWLRRHDAGRYDLIEFYGSEFWLATWWLASRRKRPLLVAHTDGLEMLADERLRPLRTARVDPSSRSKRAVKYLVGGIAARLETLAFSRADGFVTASGADRRYVVEHDIKTAARAEVVSLGLEPDHLGLPWRSERGETVVFLGSWLDRKGIKPLVAAMSALLRERAALRLALYGVDLTEVDPLPDFPADVRCRIVVHPRLPVAEIIAGLRAAKVLFFPSEYEGFGLALAEAMACGCAAVTTSTGFGADLEPGKEAMICAFGDTAAMERCLRQLLDDEPLRVRVAEAGWRRVQGLRW